jgi:hypothetical protein
VFRIERGLPPRVAIAVLIRSIKGDERLTEIIERIVDHAVVVDVWAGRGGISVLGNGPRIVVLVGDAATASPLLPSRAPVRPKE